MKVFTYYNVLTEAPDLWDQGAQLRLIELWRKSWAKHGWEPVVLGESSLSHHPDYQKYLDAYCKLPTEYGHAYESACFMRWWAVAVSQGQMMTDYDVINYGWEPRAPGGLMTLVADPPPHSSSMGVVLGEPWQFMEMADIMRDWVPCEHDMNHGTTHFGKMHCSDASMVARMFDNKNREKPAWFVKSEGSRIYGEPGWETSPLVHYGFAMHHAGHWPKCDHIERLRPI